MGILRSILAGALAVVLVVLMMPFERAEAAGVSSGCADDGLERCKKSCDTIHDICHKRCNNRDPTDKCHAECNRDYKNCISDCNKDYK